MEVGWRHVFDALYRAIFKILNGLDGRTADTVRPAAMLAIRDGGRHRLSPKEVTEPDDYHKKRQNHNDSHAARNLERRRLCPQPLAHPQKLAIAFGVTGRTDTRTHDYELRSRRVSVHLALPLLPNGG